MVSAQNETKDFLAQVVEPTMEPGVEPMVESMVEYVVEQWWRCCGVCDSFFYDSTCCSITT